MQPLAGEVGAERFRSRVGQHALDLFLERQRIVEFALAGGGEKLIVGRAAPQEERKARGQFQIANTEIPSGRRVRGNALEAEDEFRIRYHRLNGRADSAFEIALIAARLVEIQQLFQVVASGRTAI